MYESVLRRYEVYAKPSGQQSEHFLQLLWTLSACQLVNSVSLEVIGIPRNFVRLGVSTNSVEDRGQREWGSGGGSPLVRGSGGSCNLIQEISFRIKIFLIFLVL